VRIAAGPAEASDLPLLVAESKGFFRRYAVRAPLARSSLAAAIDQLKGGHVEVVAAPAESLASAVQQGARLKLVGGLVNKPAYSLVAARDVNGFPDLKGRPVATGDLKSARAVLLRRMLIANGLKPDEVILVAFGTPERELAAVVNGTAGAALFEQPRAAQLVRQRFKSLGLASASVREYQAEVLAARDEWLASGDAPARFLRGIQDADAWLYDPRNKQATAILLADTLKISNTEALDTYELLVEQSQVFPRSAELSLAGLRTVIDFLLEADALRRPAPDPVGLLDTAPLDRARAWTR
jgi:ABC-type nitrate/sulfonate/bicarbonate transport system substrate-binding protein